jgi:gliding motility-associated lipoprotein GldH
MRRIFGIYLLLLIIVFSGCGKKRIYEQYKDIENKIWYRIDRNHILTFEVPVKDTLSDYDIIMNVKYMKGYQFNDLTFIMTIYTPDKEEKDSKHTIILKGTNGEYRGKVKGDIFELSTPLFSKFRFNRKGTYKFEIENWMSKYEIPGIVKIGLIVQKNEP